VPEAQATVDSHFRAIAAEDYRGCDAWFSAAFLHAFKGDVQRMNRYYEMRHAQVGRGWQFVETAALPDPERQTAIVVVEFGPADLGAPIVASERMYYYLIREKAADGTPGMDSEGRAWRIDIYDALRYDSLAEARRRPYLYTSDAWPEDAGRELKSRQGLYRLQWALDSFFEDRNAYPEKLIGDSSKKDELINGKYLTGAYPASGYNDRGIAAVGFDEKSAGDFSYIPVDADNDGRFEAYWLLLHGKDPANFYFRGYDTVYILSSGESGGQFELAQSFASYWIATGGGPLEYTAALPREPQIEPAVILAPAAAATQPPDPQTPVAAAQGSAEQSGQNAAASEPAAAASRQGSRAGAYLRGGVARLLNWLETGQPGDPAAESPVNPLSLLDRLVPMIVWSFGF
jgi:hypothetical protein